MEELIKPTLTLFISDHDDILLIVMFVLNCPSVKEVSLSIFYFSLCFDCHQIGF